MDHGVLMLSQLRVVAGIVGRARGRGRPGKGAAEETLISQQNGLWFAPGTVLHHSGGDGRRCSCDRGSVCRQAEPGRGSGSKLKGRRAPAA